MQRPSHQLEDTLLTLQLLLSIIQNIHTSIHLPANLLFMWYLANKQSCMPCVCALWRRAALIIRCIIYCCNYKKLFATVAYISEENIYFVLCMPKQYIAITML